jgi:MFS family permease
LCHDVWSIASLRLVGGIGFGAAAPCAMALITEWLPDQYRARAVSALSVGTPLGGLLGSALLIGWLPLLGWRNAFIICGALSGLIALLVWCFVPESPVLVRRSAQADPSRPGLAAVFTTPSLRFVMGAGLAFIGVSYVAYAFAAWSPVLLTSAGFSVPQALKASLGFNLMAVLAALLTGLLADRYGTRRLMFIAGKLVLLAVLLMAAAVLQRLGLRGETAYAAVLVASGLAGGATGSVLAATYTVLANGYPTQLRATGLGIGLMIGRVGGIASTFTGGMLLAVPDLGALPLFLVLVVCALLALWGIGMIDHHVPGSSARVAR